jgi:hypothetical protein
MANPVTFVHPTFRNLRPDSDPPAQVAECSCLRDEMLADPWIDRVTTQLPKRGGAAVVVGWQKEGSRNVPVSGPYFVTEDGQRQVVK